MRRFKSKHLSQGLHELCNNNVTEGEEHFIVRCPFYRTQLYLNVSHVILLRILIV